jgi:DNA-binding SARP family transcriptional activator
VRRRDRQLFKYIALQPNGTVSRAELGQVFWPGAERHLVAQSLRTACSNIRKAIAHIVGFKQVEAYFRAGDELSIDLDNVIVDVNRFIAHSNDADEQYNRGELRSAYAHYRSAARVYRGDLLIGDAHEQWVGSLDAALKQRHVMVLERITEIVSTLDYQAIEKPSLRLVSGS